jgi:hypothetical protein
MLDNNHNIKGIVRGEPDPRVELRYNWKLVEIQSNRTQIHSYDSLPMVNIELWNGLNLRSIKLDYKFIRKGLATVGGEDTKTIKNYQKTSVKSMQKRKRKRLMTRG